MDEEGDKSAFKEDEPCCVFNEFYGASSLPFKSMKLQKNLKNR